MNIVQAPKDKEENEVKKFDATFHLNDQAN